MTVRVKRVISITLGTIGILGISVYVPAMLLAPLPPATLQVNPADNASSAAGHPELVLPGTGANAMNLLDRTATTPIATSGDQKPVVIGGAAKFVTALVVLETKPLDGTPRLLTISADDHNSYLQRSEARRHWRCRKVRHGSGGARDKNTRWNTPPNHDQSRRHQQLTAV